MRRSEVRFNVGQQIPFQGDAGNIFYTLLDGWGAELRLIPGQQPRVVCIYIPGDMFGLCSHLSGQSNILFQALTPLRCCAFEAKCISDLTKTAPDLCYALLRHFAERAQRSETHHAILAGAGSDQRVAYFMLELYERLRSRDMTNATMCMLPLQRQHLADLAGLSVIHLNRILAKFQRGGIVHLGRHDILMIYDVEKLKSVAETSPPQFDQQVIL